MGRFMTALGALLDALPFAAGVAAAAYLGGSTNLTPARAAVIAAVAGVALLAALSAVSYAKYRGADERFWLVRTALRGVLTAPW